MPGAQERKDRGDEKVMVANWGPYGVIFILRIRSPLSPLCTHPGSGMASVQDIPLNQLFLWFSSLAEGGVDEEQDGNP